MGTVEKELKDLIEVLSHKGFFWCLGYLAMLVVTFTVNERFIVLATFFAGLWWGYIGARQALFRRIIELKQPKKE